MFLRVSSCFFVCCLLFAGEVEGVQGEGARKGIMLNLRDFL